MTILRVSLVAIALVAACRARADNSDPGCNWQRFNRTTDTCVESVAADVPKQLPAGVTCEQVRSMVAEYGKVYAYAWARLQGYTAAQIAEAKRCLK